MCDDTFITRMRSKLEAARDVRTHSLAHAERFNRALNAFIAASHAHKASQNCNTVH